MPKQDYQFDYLLYIGRFRPFHNGHYTTVRRALDISNVVIICIGSTNQPRTIKNPWTGEECIRMISSCFTKEELRRIEFRELRDYLYNEQRWITQVQNVVEHIVDINESALDGNKETSHVGLIGYHKDDSSYYLKAFPQWETVEMCEVDGLHSTDIRMALYGRKLVPSDDWYTEVLPLPVARYIQFHYDMHYDILEYLRQEWDYIVRYHKEWENSPYPPVFATSDAVTIQSGHILLVKRKTAPGKGTWAIPGGFLDSELSFEDNMLKELKEETKIKLPIPVLRGSICGQRTFDHPKRSLRGRTITNAYLIQPPPGKLPKVKGGDDAEKAKWVPLIKFQNMEDQMFEDHYHIVNYFLGQI